jgi:hypothetical protein
LVSVPWLPALLPGALGFEPPTPPLRPAVETASPVGAKDFGDSRLPNQDESDVSRRAGGLKKPMIPLPESYFDVRVLALNLKIMGGKEELTPEDLRACRLARKSSR